MKKLLPFALLPFLCGCMAFSSEKMIGAKASTSKKTITWHKDGVVEVTFDKSESKGVDYRGNNIKEISTGTVKAKKSGASAGGTSYEGFKPFTNIKTLYVLGGAVVVGSVLVGYFSNWTLGILLAASGISVIGAACLFETYPWIAALPVFGIVGAGAYLIYTLYKGKLASRINEAIIPSIEVLHEDDKNTVKANVALRSGPPNSAERETLKKEIRAIKVKLGLENING